MTGKGRQGGNGSSSRTYEEELGRVLDGYLADLEVGRIGDPNQLIAEHPSIADALRECLNGLQLVGQLTDSITPGPGDPSAEPSQSPREETFAEGRRLGDFELIRLIGRGGMGLVYEAAQVSLNRRVALKVMPFAAALDPRSLQRFQVEAQAAACLHHTNIVPVHSVGIERGLPFYAMQLIEGNSLAEAIQEFRCLEGLEEPQPPHPSPLNNCSSHWETSATIDCTGEEPPKDRRSLSPSGRFHLGAQNPEVDEALKGSALSNPSSGTRTPRSSTQTRAHVRRVAELGLQAAEALDHAHSRGILHRDIKPANLLLDLDGHLWVTDFGLAQVQDAHGLTLTGDVLGTLRYMSPEQANGGGTVLDGRTDIYSLGVTLYELLTLRPALNGKDRQESLRQIAEKEPVSLRSLNPAVPRDLATIVNKAMAKELSERYATARGLVEDLQRFLLDRPILARPPGTFDRAAKWARRHKGIVTTAVAALVLALIGLATSLVLIAREQRHTASALVKAKEQGQFARQSVDDMYTEVAELWLANQPHLTDLQKQFLEKALAYYQRFAIEAGSEPDVRDRCLHAYEHVGEIHFKLSRFRDAEQAFRQGLTLARSLVVARPHRRDYQRDLAHMNAHLASVLRGKEHAGEAESCLREGAAILEDLCRQTGEVGDRVRLAGLQNQLGLLLLGVNRTTEAEDLFRHSLEHFEELAPKHSEHVEYRRRLTRHLNGLGMLLIQTGRFVEAEKAYQRCLALIEPVVKAHPEDPHLREELSCLLMNWGNLLAEMGRSADAEAAIRSGMSHAHKLAEDFPSLPSYREMEANHLRNLAGLLQKLERYPEVERIYDQLLAVQKALCTAFSDQPRFRYLLAAIYNNRSALHSSLHRETEAIEDLKGAVEVFEQLVHDYPQSSFYRQGLAYARLNLGKDLLETGKGEQAVASLEQAVKLLEGLAEESFALYETPMQLANSLIDLGRAASQSGRMADADSAFRRALEVRRKAAQAFPDIISFSCDVGDALDHLASLALDRDDGAGALQLLLEADPWHRRAFQGGLRTLLRPGPYIGSVDTHFRLLIKTLAQMGKYEELLKRVEEFAGRGYCASDREDALKIAELFVLAASWVDQDERLSKGERAQIVKGFAKRVGSRFREIASRQPLDLYLHDDFASFLVGCRDSRFFDSKLAIELSRHTILRAPEEGTYWVTLGLAYLRSGAWNEAIDDLAKGLRLMVQRGRKVGRAARTH